MKATKQHTIGKNAALIGMRIPKDFFITQGKGESDITVHAGSYHLALKAAGIEMCNIMTYSSILPNIATRIQKPRKLVHGSVMETIMAVANVEKGKTGTAGIIFGWLVDRKTKERCGGLVAEHQGEYTVNEIKANLRKSLNELYVNGFKRRYDLKDITLLTETITPKKAYGTALVALCFTTYVIPIVEP